MKSDDKQFYLGNKKLPRPGVEFEWTPTMVKDLKKCKQNILYSKTFPMLLIGVRKVLF